ncbi:transglutaminase TgpA family protein [Streptomyces nigra]|uniref:transglutaminase TgpA family protein n=1 Tax=Streptomyces nigra TaxID=1827580 RepID=UPI0036616D8D
MSGRTRMALCAAAATLMASCALLPLVMSVSWLVQAALMLAVLSGVGMLTRRVPLARPLTVATQAVVALALLTLAFASSEAVLGVIPGPEAFRHFGELLQAGGEDVNHYSAPAPLTPGIRLMLVGGVLVIGLAVDAVAVTFRSAAPAGLPLLALYSVAAGLSEGAADGLWFVVAAVGYLMLLLAEGRDRLSQWGRVFSGAPRHPGAAPGGAVAPVRTGRRIGVLALGIALVVPLALPAMNGGLLGPAGTGIGAGSGSGGTISAVNPLVSLRDSLNVEEDRQVLSLRTDNSDISSMYLRIVSLDDFDGTTWQPSKRTIEAVPDPFPTPFGLGPDIKRNEVVTTVRAADWYAQNWLPMPYPPSAVKIPGDWRYEPLGMTVVGDRRQTTRGVTYTVRSLDVRPTAKQLAEAPEAPTALRREFTQLPDSLPDVVARTAREVTEGATSRYDQAVKLQDYFSLTGGFEYDTDVKVGSGPGAIARFLKDREGFCVHFSFAMAAMARSLDIPARVAVGFAPGTPQGDGTVSVGLRDAHAWPELYFEGVGWTRFEPTPTRGSVPSYTQPDTSSSAQPDESRPSQSASEAPSPSASESDSCAGQRPELCASESPALALGSDDDGPRWYLALAWALGGLLALLIPLAPALWRLRTRAVRLGGHGRSDEDAALHTLAVWQELTDTAWDFGIPPDDSQTPRRTAARIVRLGLLDPPAAESVHRIADAVEQVLYAPAPRPVAGLAEEARRVRADLNAKVSRLTRLRALLAPRSTVRVVWALADRWVAVKQRAAAARPSWRRPWAPGQRG